MGLKRFDYKLKDNSKKKSIIVASIIVLVLLVGITIYATYAEYKITKSYNIIQGKVSTFVTSDLAIDVKLYDLGNTMTNATDFPSKDEYYYDPYNSSCENGSVINFDETAWQATINVTEKDRCTIAFNKIGLNNVFSKLQASYGAKNTITELDSTAFSKVTADGESSMHKATDDLGTSYYLRGDVENNYVQFGTYAEDTTLTVYDYTNFAEKTIEVKAGSPMYWRIVRINGDGSIRLIYDGVDKIANGTSHTATIAATAYNKSYNDAKYVGYTYDTSDTDTTQVNSTIKEVVDAWYDKHLETTYGSYIADGIFCNDRQVTNSDKHNTYFAPYDRLDQNKQPVLTCTNKSDRYTVNDTKNGNGLLSNSAGLITADEAYFAGGIFDKENSSFYLYSGEVYYTSSPYMFNSTADVYCVTVDGDLCTDTINLADYGARPVINLKANMLMYGDGSIKSPFRLSE